MKYDLSQLAGTHNNPVLGVMYELNQAGSNLFIFLLLLLIIIVAFYSYLRTTNDIGKSYIFTLHTLLVLSTLLYYMAKVEGLTLVPDLLMMSIAVLYGVSLAIIYFIRNKGA